jgi:hypothetical protein
VRRLVVQGGRRFTSDWALAVTDSEAARSAARQSLAEVHSQAEHGNERRSDGKMAFMAALIVTCEGGHSVLSAQYEVPCG